MTWMIVRLVLSLAFVGAVLWWGARLAKKRGLGGTGNGLIEVVARQRMGRSSTLSVVRVADVTLVVGATEQQVTLLAELDGEVIDEALRERGAAAVTRLPAAHAVDGAADEGAAGEPHAVRAPVAMRKASTGALSGSVFDKNGWGSFVNQLRERTVRRP